MDRTGWIAVVTCAILFVTWQIVFTIYGEKPPVWPGYELHLISNASAIPAEGAGQVIVAKDEPSQSLHFRIFDKAGIQALDKTETDFPGKTAEIQALKTRLAPLWDQFQVTYAERKDILGAVSSITSQTPLTLLPAAQNVAETPVAAVEISGPETLETLQVDDVAKFVFTTRGGGLKEAVMLDEKVSLKEKDKENYVVLNDSREGLGHQAIGAIGSEPDQYENLAYKVDSKTKTEIVFSATRPDGIQVRKRYFLDNAQEAAIDKRKEVLAHLLHCEITLTNSGQQPVELGRLWMYGGSSVPILPRESYMMGVFHKNGGGFNFKDIGWFNAFLFFRPAKEEYVFDTPQLRWGGVSNQFFTTIVRSHEPLNSHFWVSKFDHLVQEKETSRPVKLHGVRCALGLPALDLGGGRVTKLNYDIYLGPKRFAWLYALPDDQHESMAYNKVPIMGPIFGWLIKPVAQLLVTTLVWLHDRLGNFGLAVVFLTIIVRIIIWPVMAKAHSVSKRMSLLTPKIEEIKKKYPEDPQKQQQEQMKLWQEYNINPMGGCLPAFIQIPVFLGYFRMLSSAAELRHEKFFGWINDLSMPDTITTIAGFDLNLLPFLMTGTSYLQFSMMPKTGDKNQRTIFMMMPLMFLFFCYNYASALALYWTCQNIISMGQTYLLNKRPLPELTKRKKKPGKTWLEQMQERADAAQREAARQKSGGGGTSSGKPAAKSAPSSSNGKKSDTPSVMGMNTGKPSYGEKGPRSQKPRSRNKPNRGSSGKGNRKRRSG